MKMKRNEFNKRLIKNTTIIIIITKIKILKSYECTLCP